MSFADICLIVCSVILISCLIYSSMIIANMRYRLDQFRNITEHQRRLIDDLITSRTDRDNEVQLNPLNPEEVAHLVQEAAPSQGRWVSAVWRTTPDPPVETKSEMNIVKKPGKSRRKIIIGGN